MISIINIPIKISKYILIDLYSLRIEVSVRIRQNRTLQSTQQSDPAILKRTRNPNQAERGWKRVA